MKISEEQKIKISELKQLTNLLVTYIESVEEWSNNQKVKLKEEVKPLVNGSHLITIHLKRFNPSN